MPCTQAADSPCVNEIAIGVAESSVVPVISCVKREPMARLSRDCASRRAQKAREMRGQGARAERGRPGARDGEIRELWVRDWHDVRADDVGVALTDGGGCLNDLFPLAARCSFSGKRARARRDADSQIISTFIGPFFEVAAPDAAAVAVDAEPAACRLQSGVRPRPRRLRGCAVQTSPIHTSACPARVFFFVSDAHGRPSVHCHAPQR